MCLLLKRWLKEWKVITQTVCNSVLVLQNSCYNGTVTENCCKYCCIVADFKTLEYDFPAQLNVLQLLNNDTVLRLFPVHQCSSRSSSSAAAAAETEFGKALISSSLALLRFPNSRHLFYMTQDIYLYQNYRLNLSQIFQNLFPSLHGQVATISCFRISTRFWAFLFILNSSLDRYKSLERFTVL